MIFRSVEKVVGDCNISQFSRRLFGDHATCPSSDCARRKFLESDRSVICSAIFPARKGAMSDPLDDDPVKAQLQSLNEARMAMQRVVNEQKMILERHRSGLSSTSAPKVAGSPAPVAQPTRPISMTPLRQATTTISPIPSSARATRKSPPGVVADEVLMAHQRKISNLKRQYEELQLSADSGFQVQDLHTQDSPTPSTAPSSALLALQLKSATKTIESLQLKESRLQDALSNARTENLKLRGTVSQQTQQLRESHEKFETLTKDHGELDETHSKLMMQTKLTMQGKISDLTSDLEDKNRNLKKLKLELSEKDLTIQDLKMEVARLEKSRKHEKEAQDQAHESDVAQLKKRNEDLQEALKSSQEQLARLVDLHKQVRWLIFLMPCTQSVFRRHICE